MSPSSSLADTDIILLAGGLGTRLRSALPDKPKVLAPVGGGVCYLDFLLNYLHKQGARRVVLSLGYRAEDVRRHLEGNRPPLDVALVIEDKPLGTAGGLRLSMGAVMSGECMVMNGDSWTDCDLGALVDAHRNTRADLSLLCVAVEDAARYGTVLAGADDRVTGFREKDAAAGRGLVSAGVYVFGEKARAALASCDGPSLEKDFFQKRLDLRVFAHVVRAPFIDIGTPESLALAGTVFGR